MMHFCFRMRASNGVGDSDSMLLVPDKLKEISNKYRKLRLALAKSAHLREKSEPTQVEEHGQ